MIPFRMMTALFVVAVSAYVALSYATFQVPQTLAEAEICGFLPGDFDAAGQIAYPPVKAWWVSFTRKEEWWTAISMGLALAFIGFALIAARRAGTGVAAGAAMGSSLLALSALCVSCLAPAFSVVGLGLAGTLLAGVPKWLIMLNTLVLTLWGTLFLSRRLAACPLPNRIG